MNDTQRHVRMQDLQEDHAHRLCQGNACRLAAENLVAAMKKEDGTFRTYDEMVAEGSCNKI